MLNLMRLALSLGSYAPGASTPPATDGFILMESGDVLLLENGDKFLLE